jgi:hypothetical protein
MHRSQPRLVIIFLSYPSCQGRPPRISRKILTLDYNQVDFVEVLPAA